MNMTSMQVDQLAECQKFHENICWGFLSIHVRNENMVILT